MPVGQVDILFVFTVPKNDAGIEPDAGTQGPFAQILVAETGLEILFQKRRVFFYHIMVAVYQVQAAGFVEPGQHLEALLVRFFDPVQRTVFP